MKVERFESPTGVTLRKVTWEPAGSPVGTLQVTHGISEHILRYGRLAAAFNAEGWRVVGHDHRGHGESLLPSGKLGDMGEGSPWRNAIRDLRAVAESIPAGGPHVLLAHSGGSFMAQNLLYSAPQLFDGVALSGSNGPPPPLAEAGRVVARIERWRKGKTNPSALLQKLSFGNFNDRFEGRTDSDWLSRDNAEVDKYIEDPLCGVPISTSSWVDMLDSLRPLTERANLQRIPPEKSIWIGGGDQDPVGDFGKGLRKLAALQRAAGLRDVTLRLYPGARHEILNETNRDEVHEDLLTFAKRLL